MARPKTTPIWREQFYVGVLYGALLALGLLGVLPSSWGRHASNAIAELVLAYWAFRAARHVWRRTAGQKAEVIE